MSIVSWLFFFFVAVSLLVYYLLPRNKWIILLISSVFFYCLCSRGFILPVLITSVSIWQTGLYVESRNTEAFASCKNVDLKEKKRIKRITKRKTRKGVIFVVVLNVAILCLFKFGGAFFFIMHLNPVNTVVLPLAISFYTLTAIGYIVDVYKGGEAEHSYFRLLLVLIFFPLVIQGPIVRYKEIKHSLFNDNKIHFNGMRDGAVLILWGLFKKTVIADRFYPLVDEVFSGYSHYSGLIILVAVVGYMLELYCDFSGGIDIISGVSEMFGVQLPYNFCRPYFSKSVGEFWRRWHISLGKWFKDYVFMPLSLSKLHNKLYVYLKNHGWSGELAKQIPTYIAIFIVWLLNGLWHGAGWNYLVFGIYMGVIIIIEDIAKNNSLKQWMASARLWKALCISKTLCLIAIGWTIIRVNSAADIIPFILRVFRDSIQPIGVTLNSFWTKTDMICLVAGVISLLLVSILQRKQNIREKLYSMPIFHRWAVYYALLFSVLVLSYDAGDSVKGFIYANF